MDLTAVSRMFILVAHETPSCTSQSGNRKGAAYYAVQSHNSPYDTYVGKLV